ncbi:hypothetical protein J7K44_00375 [bacterium]|nr:hypothetical protein [bacterium]
MTQISPKVEKLIQQYQVWYQSLQPKEEKATIHVDEVALKVASFYEKIRTIVEWKEEHLMRRIAITRKLKRRFLEINFQENKEIKKEKDIAEPLVLELIRGGHFPNDRIEETKIEEVDKIIDKYIFIIKNSPRVDNPRKKMQFYNWIIEIAACEIEEALSPPIKERALMECMFEVMKERIRINEGAISWKRIKEEKKDILIYIAVQKALFKLDRPIITYNLLKYKFPQWKNFEEREFLKISTNIYNLWNEIESYFSEPLFQKIYNLCDRYNTPFLILGDILSEKNPSEIKEEMKDPEKLEVLIRKAYKKRLSTLKSRLFRAAIYSTLSIFLTNSISLLVLEIPLAKLITGKFMPITIAVDILGPTALMLLLVATVKPPKKSNLNLVIIKTAEIVYGKKDIFYEIKRPRKRGIIMRIIITFFYLLGAVVTLGAIIKIFQWAKFPPTSILINMIFIALIAFAGLAIRKRGEELDIEERKSGFFGFFVDIFLLPIAHLGRWLSNKWKKYNAIAAFFNALIDMPFAFFVEFLEQWRFFLKEKKEQIH